MSAQSCEIQSYGCDVHNPGTLSMNKREGTQNDGTRLSNTTKVKHPVRRHTCLGQKLSPPTHNIQVLLLLLHLSNTCISSCTYFCTTISCIYVMPSGQTQRNTVTMGGTAVQDHALQVDYFINTTQTSACRHTCAFKVSMARGKCG